MVDPISAPVAAPPGWMTFEFPCNERMRSLLRIEALMMRCRKFMSQESEHSHHAALWALFELYDLIGGRGDIKSELLQELERQRQRISQYSGKPGVSDDMLRQLLSQIQDIFEALSGTQTRLGPHIQEHEWLQSLKGRFGIPGGSCAFDMPSLHIWLSRPAALRHQMIEGWIGPLDAVFEAVSLVLRLLRESSQADAYVASKGYFELSMDGRQSQIIRVSVPKQPEVVAEISANKYVVSVRFRQPDGSMRLKSIDQDIPFQLTLCNF